MVYESKASSMMKNFIFYTSDGFTYDNNNNEVNNMQVLGHGEGRNIIDAFASFKKNQSYITQQAFPNVMAIETVGDVILNLEL